MTCLLVTANVGSIFEDPNGLLKLWVQQFLQSVAKMKPTFIALHCQEFGGKNYEESMSYVDEFVRVLLSSEELAEFENSRLFLDEDFKSNDKFTALGNLYLVHKGQEAHIWDFKCHSFVPVIGREIYSGNLESVSIKEKLKFPQEFYPECKWSRKGFMQTRWLIDGIAFDLINIHLFHDESNFVAISESPSPYAKNRRKALEYTVSKIGNEIFRDLPLFIFGDFNFRLDTSEVVRKLTDNSKPSRILNQDGDLSRLIYRHPHNDRHLLIERKHFLFSEQNFFINRHNISWLLEHDKEPSSFEGLLSELKIDFPPSYPFKEEITFSSYMTTRCPSYCDRILMSKAARSMMQSIDEANCEPKYDLMGLDVPMGDHKPVYLLFKLLPNKELTQNCKQALSSLLSHQIRIEKSDLNQTEGDPPKANSVDCIQSKSSHPKSISPSQSLAASSGEDCINGMSNHKCSPSHKFLANHRCSGAISTEDGNSHLETSLDLASKPVSTKSCKEHPLCTKASCQLNSFTNDDCARSTDQRLFSRTITASRFRNLKRYCMCRIV